MIHAPNDFLYPAPLLSGEALVYTQQKSSGHFYFLWRQPGQRRARSVPHAFASTSLGLSTGLPGDSSVGNRPQQRSSQKWTVNVESKQVQFLPATLICLMWEANHTALRTKHFQQFAFTAIQQASSWMNILPNTVNFSDVEVTPSCILPNQAIAVLCAFLFIKKSKPGIANKDETGRMRSNVRGNGDNNLIPSNADPGNWASEQSFPLTTFPKIPGAKLMTWLNLSLSRFSFLNYLPNAS